MFGGTNNQHGNLSFGSSFKGFNRQNSSELLTPNNSINPYQTYSQNKSFLNVDIRNSPQPEQHNHLQMHGTSIKYNPVIEKGGFSSPFTEKFNCLGCMDAYKNKSLEELRWEDYQCNQKEGRSPLIGKLLPPVIPQPQCLSTSNNLNNPSLLPVSKSSNDNYLSNANQLNTSSFFTNPPQLTATKSVHNFSIMLNPEPAAQNLLKKNEDNLCNFTPSSKSIPLQLPDSTTTLFLPEPDSNVSPVLPDPAVHQQQTTNIFPSSADASQAPEEEFSNNVHKIFQPFPRRDFLVSVGSNLSLESLGTDRNAIDDILNEINVAEDYTEKKSSTRTYSSLGVNIRKSFFEDIAKYVPINKSNCCLVLNRKHDEHENVEENARNDIGIFDSFSSSKEFLQNLQVTVANTVNVHHNLLDSKNPKVEAAFTEENSLDEKTSCCGSLEVNRDKKFKKSLLRLKSLKINAQTYFEKNKETKSNAKCFLKCNGDGNKSLSIETFKTKSQLSEVTQTKELYVAEKGIQVDHDTLQERGDSHVNKSCNVKLTKIGYYTEPPFYELYKYVNDNSCVIDDFVIGRIGYGKIRFLDSVDLFNLDLDEIVDIDYRNVTVYPDDNKKPTVGEGLNVPAEITMDKIWPVNKHSDTMMTYTKNINFIDKLKRLSKKQNASFVNYLPDSGSWIFNVKHF